MPNKEDVDAFKDYQPPATPPPAPAQTPATAPTAAKPAPTPAPAAPKPSEAPTTTAPVTPPPALQGKVAATPYARTLAAERGIDLTVGDLNFLYPF